jgi:hypothetical protein
MKLLTSTIAAVVLAAALCAPALAGGSVAGGAVWQSGNGATSSGAAVLLSTTTAVPVLPATLTADGTFSFVNNAIGIGYGIGKFGAGHAGGVATGFLLHQIAPRTSVELRGYFPNGDKGSTAYFLGLRFSL